MRRLPLLLVAAALACTSEVTPTNPFDPATPLPLQAKARVAGHVEAAGRASQAGIDVYLLQDGQPLRSFSTDAAGAFSFDSLTPSPYAVAVTLNGYVTATRDFQLSAGEAADLGTLPLQPLLGAEAAFIPGSAMLGKLAATPGAPVEADPTADHGGILVEARGLAFTYTAVTATSGDFQLTLPPGTYALKASRTSFVASAPVEVAVGRGETATKVVIVLATNPATVSGQVLAERLDGSTAPLADALVTLDGTSATGLTGPTGDFTLDQLAPGSYLLRVVKDGYVSAAVPVLNLVGGELRALASPVAMTLERGALRGQVALADSPGDASGAVVEVTGTGRAAVTGADGVFAFEGLVTGTYELRLRRDGYGLQVVGSLLVTAGAVRQVPTVTLLRQGGSVTIAEGAVTQLRTVTLQLGAPAAAGWRASEDPTFTDAALGDTGATTRPYGGPGSTAPFTLSDRDGRHDVTVVFVDAAGATLAAAMASVVLDRLAPSAPSVTIAGGASFVRSSPVALSLGARDLPPPADPAAAVSGLWQVELADNSAFAGSVLLDYNVATTWSLSPGDGIKSVHARFIDRAGNVSTAATALVTLDTLAPADTTLAVAGPAAAAAGFTSTPLVTLALGATDANAGAGGEALSVLLSNTPGFVGARWQPFAPSLSWLLEPGDGTRNVHARFMDPAGNESAPISRTIELRSAGPTSPSVAVVDGLGGLVAVTRLAPLRVRLSAGGAPVRALVADNPGLVGAASVTLVGEVLPFTPALPVLSLSPPDGQKTVYARFADAAGNLSELATATVTYDTTPPLALPPSLTPATFVAGGTVGLTWPAAGQETVDVAGAGVVPQSGVAAPAGGTLQVSLTAGDGAKAIQVTYRDAAGNSTALAPLSITRDGTAPAAVPFVVTGRLADGLASTLLTATASVTLDLSAQLDATSGLAELQLSNDGTFASAAWQPFEAAAAAVPWVLAPGDGPRVVHARLRDRAGNLSGPVQGSITLHQAPPTGGRLAIEGGATITGKGAGSGQLVGLSIAASNAAEMLVTVDGIPGPWETYATSKQVSLGLLDGLKVVSVLFRNDARVEGAGASAAIFLDTTAPALQLLELVGTLGDGQASTSWAAGPVVVARAGWDPADAGVSRIAFLEASGPCLLPALPRWQPVAQASTLVLTGADGAKQVCAWLADEAGNVSAPRAATIALDTVAPPGPVFTDLGTGITNQPTVTGTLAVLPGGEAGIEYQCLGGQYAGTWTACTPDPTRRLVFTLARNQDNVLGVRTRDLARNASAGTVVSVTHDDVAPVPPAITGLKTTATTAGLTWTPSPSRDTVRYLVHYGTAPGDVAGVGADQGVAPVEAGAATAFQLSGLSSGTSYYLSVSAVDAAGNVSEPSGERNANPNRISPRVLSAYGAEFQSLGARADGTVRVYLAQRQGLVQLDATDPANPVLLGRAQLPGIAPLATAPLLVFGCTWQGVVGDCVYLAGSSLEADYRSEPAAYRASVTVFFFPAAPRGGVPSLGVPVASLHARAETLALAPDGLTLWAVERHQVRAYSVADPLAPVPLGEPLQFLDAAGQKVVPTRFHGAGVVPGGTGLLLGVLASPAAGDPTLYTFDVARPTVATAFPGTALRTEAGGSLTTLPNWDYYAPVPAEPVAAFFGAFHVGYVTIDRVGLTGVTQVATFDPAGLNFPRPERSLLLASGPMVSKFPPRLFAATAQDAAPAVASGDHFYLGTYDATVSPRGNLEVRRFTDAAGALQQTVQVDLAQIGNEVRALGVADAGGIDRVLASGGSSFVGNRVTHAEVKADGATAAVTLHAEFLDNSFAQGNGWVFARAISGAIDVLDVSNPTVPARVGSYAETGHRLYPKVVHGHTLYALDVLTSVFSWSLRLFDIGADGTLTSASTVPLSSTSAWVVPAGNRLFLPVSGGIQLWDVTDRTAPVLSATLPVSANSLVVRGDTLYVTTSAGALQIYGLSGTNVTMLGQTASVGIGYNLSVRGDTALLDTTVVDVSNPSAPAVETGTYGVYKAAVLQGGYLIGQSKWGTAPSATTSAPPPESGPRFYARGGGFDGAQPFAACGAGTSYYPTTLEVSGATLFAHCNQNGLVLSTPVNPAGGELASESLVNLAVPYSYGPPVAPLAGDDNLLVLGGINAGGSTFPSFWRADPGRQAAGVPPRPVFVGTAPAIPHQLAWIDGDVLAAFAGNPATLQLFDASRGTAAWGPRGSVSTGVNGQAIPALVSDTEAAYAVVDQSGASSTLVALDVRSKSAPLLAATIAGAATEKLIGLALHRRRLYAASTVTTGGTSWDARVRVWSALAPAALVELAPVTLGALHPMKTVRDVAVTGRWLFFTYDGAVGHSPYGLGVVLLGPGGDGTGATLVGTFESPLPLGNPTPTGDLLYARHNLGLATFDLAPLFRGGRFPTYLGSRRTSEALFTQNAARLLVAGPWAYLLGGDKFRVFDLR